MKKGRIIHVMGSPPPYDLYWDVPRPEINWDTPDGNWVGIYGSDWADLIGKEILKINKDFAHEVWQPDLRADKVYSHNLPTGVCHKLFPAENMAKSAILKRSTQVSSKLICQELRKAEGNGGIIIQLDSLQSGMSNDILKMRLSCPIVVQLHGEVQLPLNNIFKIQKNVFRKIGYILQHIQIKKNFRSVNLVSYCNEKNMGTLRRYYRNKLIFLPVGVDFDIWKSDVPRHISKSALGLETGVFTILSPCRLNKLKQIDKLIEILSRLDDQYNFQLVIAGHGTSEFEQELYDIGLDLIGKNKLIFMGYVTGDKLVQLYNSADLFATTSFSEGMPVSAIEAMAMEVPIFSTNTGIAAKILTQYGSGVVVPVNEYGVWEEELRNILEGKAVKILPREIAKSTFHWPILASKYIDEYQELYRNHYGE